ncbi:hypothetical protein BBJ28_00011257 [Nothophytophthora sp. Chile5]|nr:hypothetical protein BBJ28_00011257 [Nothophytophthora sp. Chile5]
MRALLVALATMAAVCLIAGVRADFNECLGLAMASLQSLSSCQKLFNACQLGVHKLNQQLDIPLQQALNPVSVISASESKTMATNGTRIAMLVQLAPLTECSPVSPTTVEKQSKVAFYSILLTGDLSSEWELEGYKRHSLSGDERAQIVEEYKTGQFYGSKLAIGIFDTSELPSESDSQENTPRSPFAVIAVSASVLASIGLILHHRQRLQNGYAPILFAKGGHVQGKKPSKTTPEQRALRAADPVGSSEGQTFKQEATERFAV